MQLTRTQVIAIFLASSAKAQNCDGCATVTLAEVINSNSSLDTTADGTREFQLTVDSSFQECAEDFDCEDEDEMCGTILQTGVDFAASTVGCVYADTCGALGKVNGGAWSVHCWDTDAAPEPLPVPADLLASVEDVITADEPGTWDEVYNLKIPSIQNYQTGWWIRQDDTAASGIYAETDKPVNNVCSENVECEDDSCCAPWPDTNNKRCILRTIDGVEQTLAPFSNFTPVCAADPDVEEPIQDVSNAKDELAAEAQSKAAEALTEFNQLADETIRTNAGYDDMSAEDQAAWDEERAERIAQRDAADALDRENADFENMSDDAKAVYDAEYLKWKKEWFAVCQESPDSIDCRKGREIRDAVELARNSDGYYEKDADARETFDDTQAEETDKEASALAVAWKEDNKPASGEPGSACAGSSCVTEGHCCGTSTPVSNAAGVTDGQETSVCATIGKWTDQLDVEQTHVCGAQKLIATAGALLAAIYLM